ncbi:MAG: radC [Gammaproteobacteria bacterium]|nr:radC [Gammaproteobacteria bacterium]
MPGQASAGWRCPQCGYTEPSNDDLPPAALFHPWHLRGRNSVKAYVETLGSEVREWLLALYVDDDLNLLAVDTVGRGDVGSVKVGLARILCRGHMLDATGFILVHNHPSGDPSPSPTDLQTTVRLRRTSEDMEMPLLDHLIIAGEEMVSVGGF